MANPESPQKATPAHGSVRPWQMGAVVAGLVVLGGILFVLTGDDDADNEGSEGTSSTASTVDPDPVTGDDSDPLPTTPGGEPALSCTESALVASTPSVALAAGSVATGFACTPPSAGDPAGGFAWMEFAAPGTDPLHVFFRAEAGEVGADGAVSGEWVVLSFGSDVFCDDEIPVEVCAESLAGAPVR